MPRYKALARNIGEINTCCLGLKCARITFRLYPVIIDMFYSIGSMNCIMDIECAVSREQLAIVWVMLPDTDLIRHTICRAEWFIEEPCPWYNDEEDKRRWEQYGLSYQLQLKEAELLWIKEFLRSSRHMRKEVSDYLLIMNDLVEACN